MFGLLYRYISAAFRALSFSYCPDYKLQNATYNEQDITNEVILWLASKDTTEENPYRDKLVTISYWYKGTGPYKTYFDTGEDLAFPPNHEEVNDITPLEKTIVLAEVDGEDFTEELQKFNGPASDFHGRSLKDLNMKCVLNERKYEKIYVLYADGNEINL